MAEGTTTDKKILIVEDSPAMRQLLNMASRRHHAVIVEANDGLAALKQLTQQTFDLIFVDLNMPVMDGFKLIKRVRDDPQHAACRICVVTTEGAAETELQVRALGADYFLRKPTSRRDVDAVLAEALGQ